LVHAPRAGVSFELSELKARRGWFTVHTPTALPDGIVAPDAAVFYFSVHGGGGLAGSVRLSINLADKLIDKTLARHELRLMYWDGLAWQALPGVYAPQSDTLDIEVPADLLRATLFALALPDAADESAAAWIIPQDRWIVGEALSLQLNDPDQNTDPGRKDRLEDAVQVTETQTGKTFSATLTETAPDSGLFALVWPDAQKVQGTLTLRYEDPNAAEDHCQVELEVLQRAPFVVDSAAEADGARDFLFSNLPETFTGTPHVQPRETIYIRAGVYTGRWRIDVPDVRLQADPGALLKGSLVLAAAGISVDGLAVKVERGSAIEVSGDGVALAHINAFSRNGRAIDVTGNHFSLQASSLEGATTSLRLGGNNAKISGNAIIGAPQLLGDALAVEDNWWGNAYGPWEDTQESPKEGVFPWLLSPPVDSLESIHVEGATWHHPGIWEVLGQLGNALLVQNFSDAWGLIKQLFGQGSSLITVAPGWSLHVNATGAGRLIVQRQTPIQQADTLQKVGIWLERQPQRLRLQFTGRRVPLVQWQSETGWVTLKARRTSKGQWQFALPRLSPSSPMPLWLRLSEG